MIAEGSKPEEFCLFIGFKDGKIATFFYVDE